MSLIPVVENPAITVKLRKPVMLKDEEVNEILLREPTAGDIIRNGNPVNFDGFSEQYAITFDEAKVVKMLVALSNGLPRATFERMQPNDFMDCCWAIAPFFVPWINRQSAETSPTLTA